MQIWKTLVVLLSLLVAGQAACTSASEGRAPGQPAGAAPKNQRLGPPAQSYVDPEFLQEENLFVFQDSADHTAWLGRLDPETGGLVSATGKDYRVDVNIAPIYRSFNGPEFGVDANGWAIYYSKAAGSADKNLQIWRAKPRFTNGGIVFDTEQLTRGVAHQTAIAQKDNSASTTHVFAIAGGWRGGDAVWFDANDPGQVETFIKRRPSGTNAEFIPGSSQFITSVPDSKGVRQLAVVDRRTRQRRDITSGATDFSSAWGWRAPEYGGATAVLALENQIAIGVWVETDGQDWTKVASLPLPKGSRMKRLRSPEAFTFQGASYILFGAHEEARHGAGEIWVYSMDGVAERCDTGENGVFRLEPEPYVTKDRAFVFYAVRPDATTWELWQCEPRLVKAGVVAGAEPAPSREAPRHATSGDTRAVSESLVLQDATRNKQLPVRVSFPASGTQLPVVVFSHGAWSSRDHYQPLARSWARRGYVVIQPTHEDSAQYGHKPGSKDAFKYWSTRPKDVSFVLDSLAEIERSIPALEGRIDRQRIGVAGHSFGGQTAQLVAGAKISGFAARKAGRLSDSRVKAALLLSPTGSSRMINKEAWAQISLPMLTITGTADNSRRADRSYQWRMEPFEYGPVGDNYLVVIDGADHGLGGVTDEEDIYGWGKDNDKVELVQSITGSFWDAFLRGERQALDAAFSSSRLAKGKANAELKIR